MVETLTNSGLVKLAAGKNVSDSLTPQNYTDFINEAEAQILAETGVDWVSIFPQLEAGKKEILQSAASAWAAVNAIRFDPEVYTSNISAFIVNINLDRYDRAITKLKDPNISGIIGGKQESS